MLKFYQKLFNQTKIDLKRDIQFLEKSSGLGGHDIRLYTDLKNRSRNKVKELGLDHQDYYQKEVYYALLNNLKTADKSVYRKIRTLAARHQNALANFNDGLKIITNQRCSNLTLTTLKETYIKKYLVKNPPRKLIKALHFRSVNSLLKREELALIILGINYYECDQYLNNFYLHYKKVKNSDFKESKLKVLSLDIRWQKALRNLTKNITKKIVKIPEIGSILILESSNKYQAGKSVYLLSSILEECYLLNVYSSYLKYHLLKKDLPELFYNLNFNGPQTLYNNKIISWGTVHELIFKHRKIINIPYFKKSEFLDNKKVLNIGTLFKELEYWNDSFELADYDQASILSFNLMDCAYNLYHKLEYEKAFFGYFIEHFKNKFYYDYLNAVEDKEYLNNLD